MSSICDRQISCEGHPCGQGSTGTASGAPPAPQPRLSCQWANGIEAEMCAHACCPPGCRCAEHSEINVLAEKSSYEGEEKVKGQKGVIPTLPVVISNLL